MSPAVTLTAETIAALLPLHVLVTRGGRIAAVGPTLAKLRPGERLTGRPVLEVFEVRRPAAPRTWRDLAARACRTLRLGFRGDGTAFKGQLLPLPGGGALLDLSFGIGAPEAVARHRLTSTDFSPTDLTVELLYLVEAQSAAMAESRRLNLRLEGARSAAEAQALSDPLTGLANRRAAEEMLMRLTERRLRFGLIQFDLDRFKAVNDTMGHAAGDAVLAAVACALAAEVRQEDLAARTGGDEFLLVVPGQTDAARLAALARRVILRIEEPVAFGGALCRISASAGVTVSTLYARPDPARMLQDADQALYASKRAGRGGVTVWGAAEAKMDGAA